MNNDEREQVTRFLADLTGVRLLEKDVEAERLIRDAVAQQPDAAYLLVQRAMLLERALSGANSRIAELQQRHWNEPRKGVGSASDRHDPWAPPSERDPRPKTLPGAGYPASHVDSPAARTPTGGGSGFLGDIAATAAGVVAGSFLFRGLEGLLGHHSAPGAAWADPGADGFAEPPTISEHFDSEPERGSDAGTYFANEFDESDDEGGDDAGWI